jgi:hypothetical protein
VASGIVVPNTNGDVDIYGLFPQDNFQKQAVLRINAFESK